MRELGPLPAHLEAKLRCCPMVGGRYTAGGLGGGAEQGCIVCILWFLVAERHTAQLTALLMRNQRGSFPHPNVRMMMMMIHLLV